MLFGPRDEPWNRARLVDHMFFRQTLSREVVNDLSSSATLKYHFQEP
jgi:hypothetical protein